MASNDGNTRQNTSETAKTWLRELQRSPRDGHEAIALFVHALLLGHGFRDADDSVPANGIRESWGDGGYGGTYRHQRSALTFEVRSTRLGARLRVTALHDAAEDVATLDLRVADHYRTEGEADTWVDRLQRVEDVATLVLVNIAHKLVPDSAKAGYEEGAAAASGSTASASSGGGGIVQLRQQPRPQPGPRPVPPVADDPLRIGPIRGGPRMPGYPGLPNHPVGIPGFGSDDLMPQMPGGPMFAPRGGAMGGNLMGPRNFRPGAANPYDRRGGGGRGLPLGVPPGARYDPIGPSEPDFDELLPPGTTPGRGPPGGGGGGGPDNDRPPDMYW